MLGPKAILYESDDEDVNSGSSFDGPLKGDDPWGTLPESEEDEGASTDDESELSDAEDMMPDIMLDEDAKYNGKLCQSDQVWINKKRCPFHLP